MKEYFHTDWMGTDAAQRLLQFQTKTFDDYLKELRATIGMKRYLVRLGRGLAKRQLLSISPYYRANLAQQ